MNSNVSKQALKKSKIVIYCPGSGLAVPCSSLHTTPSQHGNNNKKNTANRSNKSLSREIVSNIVIPTGSTKNVEATGIQKSLGKHFQAHFIHELLDPCLPLSLHEEEKEMQGGQHCS